MLFKSYPSPQPWWEDVITARLSQQRPQGPVSVATGLWKVMLLSVTHQASFYTALLRGNAYFDLLLCYFLSLQAKVISTWRHHFGWDTEIFPSSPQGGPLACALGWASSTLSPGLAEVSCLPENLPCCCCYYILLRKMFLKLLHQKSLSKHENMGCLSSCRELPPPAGERWIQLWFVHTMDTPQQSVLTHATQILGESPENDAGWTKPIPKGYILCYSIYITFWKWQDGWNGDQISGCVRLRRE